MSKRKFPKKILWLASYPKSGNTWYRSFLTALLNEGDVKINRLETDGIFSSRRRFDEASDIDSGNLYSREVKTMLADTYRHIANNARKLNIIKIHDLFENDQDGKCIVPEDVTLCAIYFVRNPLDIAASLANHMDFSIQNAVDMINRKKAGLRGKVPNHHVQNQFDQNLSDWSTHVNSWAKLPSFPVCIIRYEDMLSDSFETFKKTINFIGWDYSDEQILQAIDAATFEKLSQQEIEIGFHEKAKKEITFFRSGTKGNWEKELNSEQINAITQAHGDTMMDYNYLL